MCQLAHGPGAADVCLRAKNLRSASCTALSLALSLAASTAEFNLRRRSRRNCISKFVLRLHSCMKKL